MLFLALALFLSEPVPLEMPRAEAYLVRDEGSLRLEDRYNVLDLWMSKAVDGRWTDDDGRVFLTATLSERLPDAVAGEEAPTMTRGDYSRQVRDLDVDDERSLRDAIAMISPIPLVEKGEVSNRKPKGVGDLVYWQGTNTSAIICTYREKPHDRIEPPWHLVCWTLAAGDDFAERLERFEEDFLRNPATAQVQRRDVRARKKKLSERELLRADARHSVAQYHNWHVTDSDEFVVLDDLEYGRSAVATLTNEFKVMRARYATTLPTGIDGSNVLAVARVFASREEYQEALAVDGLTNLNWSAAYWSQARRELVAYLPESGTDELISTVRHEAFHQYLAYATSMISVSPWLNEGYAQFFEDDGQVDDHDGMWSEKTIELAAMSIPALLAMDYSAFYAGSDKERMFKYRLAQSMAVFIERGAPKVRFAPFAKLKQDYFKALFESKDMAVATATAFGSKENVELFVAEWKKYMTEGRFKTDDHQ